MMKEREGFVSKLPRLAVIGHTYALKHNREKVASLGEHFEVRCFVPDFRGEMVFGQPFEEFDSADEPEGNFEVCVLRKGGIVGKRTCETIRGLSKKLSEWAPEFILVDAEPWAWLRWQVWWWCQSNAKCCMFEFTWENLKRPGLAGVLLSLIYRLAARTGDGVICGNQAAKRLFLEAGKIEEDILVAGQLGVPDAGFPNASVEERENWRQKYNFPIDAHVVGFCGRFVPEKGVLLLVEAVAELRECGVEVYLCLLGQGPLLERLKDEVSDFGVVLPPVGHREVPDILRNWDILVLPSQQMQDTSQVWEEQFGRAIIEAVAAGVPALGSRHGAIPEVLGVEKSVFEEGSIESLTERLRYYLNDGESLERLLEEQRCHVFSNYTHSTLAQIYADFLREVRCRKYSSPVC